MQTIQASVHLNWSGSNTDNLRDEAERESEELSYIFENAQNFIQTVVSTLLDEPSTRESLNNFIVFTTSGYPFLLMNEYRIASATNSLMRAEATKQMI